MFGESGNKLILEAKRGQDLDDLPLFQEDLIRDVVRECSRLQQHIDRMDLENENTQDVNKNVQLFVDHLIMRRNKRCLLAYERIRTEKLASLVWDNLEVRQQTVNNLNFNEEKYLDNYNEIMTEYKNQMPDIDLSGSLEPPNEVFIDVRVLKDAGEIQTEYGVFNLTKDSQFFVRHADVERLIQQGYLEKL